MAATATSAGGDAATEHSSFVLDPKKGRKRDLVKFLLGKDEKNAIKFLDSSSTEGVKGGTSREYRLNFLISVFLLRMLAILDKPMKYFGYAIDFVFNFLNQNGGFSGILNNLLHGKLKIPKRESANFISTIGLLDQRLHLYRKEDESVATDLANIKSDLGNKYLMDLSMMAAKLVYENEKVVQTALENQWKMHFVGFYNCYNDAQKEANTQLFICCDKPKDANLIIVSFRGTEPFCAKDWASDFDMSYYEIPKVGKFHMGFLEAMGMGSRNDANSFKNHFQKRTAGLFNLESDATLLEWANKSAYYLVTFKLKSLLREHRNAKFVVTGHSLGGALAILYPCLLVVQEETELLNKLLNIYTFGQPRIGDEKLGTFMESHLNYPVTRYYRVVYCNDLVPRVPPEVFGFKHFGTCLYYNSRYFGGFMEEEPNKNFFSLIYILPMHINAIWELFRSFIIHRIYGMEYYESWFSTSYRMAGMMVPGVASHGPVDYVNSCRLGRGNVSPVTSLISLARNL